MVTSKNSNKCPPGLFQIESAADCWLAAEKMGLEWGYAKSTSYAPKGCYITDIFTAVHFNKHSSGQARFNAAPLCTKKSAPYAIYHALSALHLL